MWHIYFITRINKKYEKINASVYELKIKEWEGERGNKTEREK